MTVSKAIQRYSPLYDGKTVRSSAPSRKKAAGQIGAGVTSQRMLFQTVEIPSFIESLLGGPLFQRRSSLPPAKWVQTLQLGVYVVLVALAMLTYIISPPEGTIWYMILEVGSCNLSSN